MKNEAVNSCVCGVGDGDIDSDVVCTDGPFNNTKYTEAIRTRRIII
jgi:hypothetical protein